jgi:peptide/nickel transport system permease protein
LGLALGLAAAASRGSPLDWAIGALTTILLASPGVVLAVLLLAGAARLGLPIGGLSGGDEAGGTAQRLVDLVRHLIVPATAIALVWLPAIARHTRTALIGAMDAPYVLGARSRGIGRWRLLLVHALREALAPVSTLFGLSLSAVLSASLVVEVVMAWKFVRRRCLIPRMEHALTKSALNSLQDNGDRAIAPAHDSMFKNRTS